MYIYEKKVAMTTHAIGAVAADCALTASMFRYMLHHALAAAHCIETFMVPPLARSVPAQVRRQNAICKHDYSACMAQIRG